MVPLPFWRDVVASGSLLPKARLETARPTTEQIDRALGFDGFVHLYLAQGPHRIPDLPILSAQLQPARKPPFPHVVLELHTAGVEDAECQICNWNLAVSRPGVPGVAKGGNWTRGTKPSRILEVWDALRATNPSPSKAKGYFGDARIPTLQGEQIRENLALLNKAPRKMPELLLSGAVPLSRFARLIAFSATDRRQVAEAGLEVLPIELNTVEGYGNDSVPRSLRRRIEAYFSGEDTPTGWDFDAVRPRSS